jgi:diguanylate cyclase (GGDEF)-like protein/PAS domain S-box-containing protein
MTMSLATPAGPETDFDARLRLELQRWTAVTPAMLHSIDEKGLLISVSDAWLAKLGYARDEVLGRPSSDFLSAESREHAARNVLPEFFRLGRCDNVQYQMVCKDGSLIDVLLSAVIDGDVPGHGRISRAVITDVTALKQTKSQLAESEARYRGLVEDQSELISLASPQGELRYVNHAYASFFGKQPEEMIGQNLFEQVPLDGRLALADHLRRVCAATHGVEIENHVVLPNGEKRWLAWTNRAVTDGDGRVTAIHSVGRDIGERVRAEQRLQESEIRYRFLAENSSDVIALLARDGTRLYVSPACYALTGYTPEEMQTMRTGDSTHPDDVERVLRVLANESGQSTVTYRMRRKDGSYVWVETSCKPVEIEGRHDVRLTIVRDIDERVRTEQRLHESESRYRFLAENSADLIVLVDCDGKRTYASPASKAILGYEPEEMLDIRSQDSIHPDDAERVLDILLDGPEDRTRTDRTMTYRIRRKDGSYVWVEATGRAVDIAGQPDQRLLIIRDIEQRMMAEQLLREREAQYRLLADNSSDMVFQLDQDLVRRYVSPACRELLGYEPEELIGIKPASMAHPEDSARLTLVFETLMSGRADRQSIINRIRHRNGNWIWVEAQFRTLKHPETSAITGIIGALRDISVRKAVEDELAEANRRLKALAGQDGLTGLANRRAFDEALAREHRRTKREKKALSLIMIDVDRFKLFNDCYGHPAGDDCLRRVAAAIADTARRPGDIAARYGGEEFAVLLPDTDETGAELIAARILGAVCGLKIRHDGNINGLVSISAGVACLVPAEAGGRPETLIQTADRALYCAKDGGRNAVVCASAMESNPGPATASRGPRAPATSRRR